MTNGKEMERIFKKSEWSFQVLVCYHGKSSRPILSTIERILHNFRLVKT